MGASAGGLEVFAALLDQMPCETGLAFVLIQHLDPHHETLMPELLAKHTKMKVLRAKDGLTVQADHVYVIPPNSALRMVDCAFKLEPLPETADRRLIDQFFRSAAEDQKEGVIGIVLSGTGSDGTMGLRAIRENGGLTLAQKPETAKFDGMPRSAIAAGFVDLVLTVDEIPGRIVEYAKHLQAVHRRKGVEIIQAEIIRFLPRIFPILTKRTGHDFSRYKQSTLARRVQRRMQVRYLESVSNYLDCLREEPEEVDALFKDLLIGVTQFFRDPASFEALSQKVIPGFFKGKTAKDQVRVWVPGCATGEEAYSLAILLAEQTEECKEKPRIQVFATDLDVEALEFARKGKYDSEIAQQLSPARLKKYFQKTSGGYEVVDSVREMCVFSPHNVVKDPPFSKLDLISCRNLLIYLEVELQKKLLPLFHYALNPSGYLFLGPSENVASRSELFRVVDQKHRLFQRKPSLLHLPVSVPIVEPGHVTRLHASISPSVAFSKEQGLTRSIERIILEEYAPASVVINRRGEALYFSGNTGGFLEPATGVPTNKIVAMARGSLRLELRTAVHQAVSTGKEVVRQKLEIKRAGERKQIDLIVRPLPELGHDNDFYIVLFRELSQPNDEGTPAVAALEEQEHPIIKQLESELRTTRDDLQTTIEELETSNEELKSANEELLSMNEELQSANEELQTSKEEVQSANEELQRKIEEIEAATAELRRSHEDRARLAALVHGSEDAIISKTLDGVITSWNKAAERMFGYTSEEMIGQSILKIIPANRHEEEGRILIRLRQGERVEHYETERITRHGTILQVSLTTSPIRDPEGFIVGAAKIARDITAQKAAQRSTALLAAIVDSSDDAIVSKTLDGLVTSWNKAAERIFGYTAEEIVGQPITLLFPPDRLEEEPAIIRRIARGESVDHFETMRRRKDGKLLEVSLTISPIKDANGRIIGASKIARDITAQKAAIRSSLHLAAIVDSSDDAIVSKTTNGIVTSWNKAAERIFGYTAEEMIGQPITKIFPEERLEEETFVLNAIRRGERIEHFDTVRRRKDGRLLDISLTISPIRDVLGNVVGASKIARDITARKQDTRILELLNETGKAIASELKLDNLVQIVTEAGTKLSGAQFGAFFYNVINAQGESYLLYTLSGAPREAFDKFGLPRNTPIFEPTFRGQGVVRSDDITRDPRYGTMPPHYGMPKGHLPVRSYLAAPVISRSGEVIGGLFFGHPEAGVFTERSEKLIVGIAAQAAVAIDNARLFERAQREIAERLRAEDALREAKEKLEERVKERTASLQETTEQLETFCYTIAHDLRSPLRAQQSFAQVLLDEYKTTLGPEGQEYARRISEAAQRLDNLVQDLLTYSRLSRSELRFENVDLNKVLRDVRAAQAHDIESRGAKITAGTLDSVFAYEPTVFLVVSNLVSNALKFVPPSATANVKLWSEKHDGRVRLWVEDNGIGIHPDNLGKIFGVFQRLHSIKRYPGTGIGLAIVQKGAERMGGKAGVESELGKGSRFWIELPAAQELSSAVSNASHPEAEAT